MNRKITLEQALESWDRWRKEQISAADHVSIGELYELLIHPSGMADREKILQHLAVCPDCLTEFAGLDRCRQEEEEGSGWDVALRRAAATTPDGPRRITTEKGLYTIDIRPDVADRSRGLIIVRVSAVVRERLEGSLLTLVDGQGRVLLRGRISGGEVVQAVEDLVSVDDRLFVHVQLSRG
jgi:hypothetical protein